MTTLVLEQADLIDRLEKAAIDQNTTPDTLLHTAIQEFLDKIERRSVAIQLTVPPAPPEFRGRKNAIAIFVAVGPQHKALNCPITAFAIGGKPTRVNLDGADHGLGQIG